ncbi:di-heme cytochrome c peroxidase [Oleiphilus messinensis]|uniref:Di-heme cytochrome c peroxidase n=1 Tax=Oleiphilus messinensis TaxID=141451 RepID=A0A1Y0I4C0_9GAMM|nr:cytochrome-c peroxidase [Oleiphilus messinensis]ARU55049.1 di-heme cytochrome c peroxidase [Oleiphilus messinensis]
MSKQKCKKPVPLILNMSLAAAIGIHFSGQVAAETGAIESLEGLGRSLYFDQNLSRNRTQSCASCHAPEAGFADPRDNGIEKMVSLGDDGQSLGDRNAPTASYARFSPVFHKSKDGKYVGGQFLDGRASTLSDQAGGPPLNPLEMGMPDKKSVIERIRENPAYVSAFQSIFGADILQDDNRAYQALTDSIAAFENSQFFAPFDSKYDRYLRGEYKMSEQEDLGMTLFFSQQFTNCNLCHQLNDRPATTGETFTNYEYHNIGVPVNTAVRSANGLGDKHVDDGLLANDQVDDPAHKGKFKVPTLRNVAVTGPYMHNGVFQDLRTVVAFYNKYNSRSEKRQINPETDAHWAAPEVSGTLSLKELETGPALDDKRIDALVAFMKTLTDKRYEPLLTQRPHHTDTPVKTGTAP